MGSDSQLNVESVTTQKLLKETRLLAVACQSSGLG